MGNFVLMKSLIVGFEAKRAVSNMTGLGNYSRLVVEVLSQARPDWQFRLYAPRIHDNPRLTPLLGQENVVLVAPDDDIWRHFSSAWRVYGGLTSQIRRDGVQLFHGLSNELPLDIKRAHIPSVVTIHDLIFRRFPSGYNSPDRAIYDYKFSHSARNATRVIAISECTKRDLVELYDIDPAKIDVVYQGCNPVFSQPVSPETILQARRRYKVSGNYFISVGTVEERKNQLLAVRALPYLPSDLKLVIVGRPSKGYAAQVHAEIERLGVASRVIWLQNVGLEALPPLYAGALFSSYTSRYEGFGLPVIESINCGTPVIAATGSCLEEAGGPGAIYVNPDDLEAYIAAVEKLLNDPSLRASMVAEGRAHTAAFSPSQFAASMLSTYAKALSQ